MGGRLVVGADGGNSKTDLVLATTEGAVLARVAGPGTRPYLDGLPATADALAALVLAAREQAGIDPTAPVDVGCFYLANVDVPDEEAAMHAALADRGVAQRLEVGNDTVAVLRAGAPRGWGVAVIAGAGINAIGRHPDGRVERFLGLGPWSGDWGGGDGIVRSAVAAAVRAGDGRGPATALTERIVATFAMPVEEVAFAAHHGRLSPAELRAFGPVVFATAHAGDEVARRILERTGEEVVSFAGALLRRMQLTDADAEVVLGGRVLQIEDRIVMERIRAGLGGVAPKARLRVLDVAPVAGAVAAALETAGATPDQMLSARAAIACS